MAPSIHRLAIALGQIGQKKKLSFTQHWHAKRESKEQAQTTSFILILPSHLHEPGQVNKIVGAD